MAIIDSVEHLRGALDYHLARHNLLASNLAHIDTPGYKPVDLERSQEVGGGNVRRRTSRPRLMPRKKDISHLLRQPLQASAPTDKRRTLDESSLTQAPPQAATTTASISIAKP